MLFQERTGVSAYEHDSLRLQYKLDNEFELVFVVAYQKILQLSYVDKFLDDIHLEFRDRFKNQLEKSHWFFDYGQFADNYHTILLEAEQWGKNQAKIPKQMRSFDESAKSKKTVASMIERKDNRDDKKSNKKQKKVLAIEEPEIVQENGKEPKDLDSNGDVDMDSLDNSLELNLKKLSQRITKKKIDKQKSPKSEKAGKKPRVWGLGGTNKDLANLERTRDKPEEGERIQANTALIGQMKGGIRDLEVESDSEEEFEEISVSPKGKTEKKSGGGMFSVLKGLVGNKQLTSTDLDPVLEKMKDHLIAKNVASDISVSLCNSMRTKLEGKVLGTFESVASTVKMTLTDSLVQILSPKRRVDILRDAFEAKKNSTPYVMSFCGVNGVGKSTNLAKILLLAD